MIMLYDPDHVWAFAEKDVRENGPWDRERAEAVAGAIAKNTGVEGVYAPVLHNGCDCGGVEDGTWDLVKMPREGEEVCLLTNDGAVLWVGVVTSVSERGLVVVTSMDVTFVRAQDRDGVRSMSCTWNLAGKVPEGVDGGRMVFGGPMEATHEWRR